MINSFSTISLVYEIGYLYLDSKMLEFLSIYLSEVLELDILARNGAIISRTEQSAILEAKRIIDNEIAYAPTCEILSKMVHLSLSKLTMYETLCIG